MTAPGAALAAAASIRTSPSERPGGAAIFYFTIHWHDN